MCSCLNKVKQVPHKARAQTLQAKSEHAAQMDDLQGRIGALESVIAMHNGESISETEWDGLMAKYNEIFDTGDAKIESPVWMVLVSRIAGQATALQNRSNLPELTQIPGMIEVILTNSGIDSDF